ncbi:MAG: AAA family ATPase [Halobacteriovoraceae bacterium]|nr:AAA family ATPase [Halobacteriovoraceae bacterium]
MYNVEKLILENIRCFKGRKEFNIRPLTFLTGENSTGKSTVLGCYQVFNSSLLSRYPDINFNIEPYNMGAFSDIARTNEKEFKIGFEYKHDKQDKKITQQTTFIERISGSEPVIKKNEWNFPEAKIISNLKKENNGSYWPMYIGLDSSEIKIQGKDSRKSYVISSSTILNPISLYIAMPKNTNELTQWRDFVESEKNFLLDSYPSHVESFAPIRSKRERTYNPFREMIDPEGNEMPVFLKNISDNNPKLWKTIKKELLEFGNSSGLFSDITVKRYEKTTSGPFQLKFKINKGPEVNMVDVGYGVSQILPILVRIFSTSINTTFLLQQPEVHLHPRVQAEISSLFIESFKRQEHKFIIETHSEYMIDRIRIKIMEKQISPDDVSLIFLSPEKGDVKVHNIRFDEQGNMLDVPDSYKNFFINEQNKLMGI